MEEPIYVLMKISLDELDLAASSDLLARIGTIFLEHDLHLLDSTFV